VVNTKAFVLDANPTHFPSNPQFLELCGHYRMRPTACRRYRARTKGKVERPFFYLEQQFIKGTQFASVSHFLEELAGFERVDLDLHVHSTTQERPIDRFTRELPHLTPPLPHLMRGAQRGLAGMWCSRVHGRVGFRGRS
jgi:hypothetical protein